MGILDAAARIVGSARLMTGAAADPWRKDWTGAYPADPLAVARPGSTEEVAALVRAARETGTPIVPVSGLTGLTGGAQTTDGLMISLDRMSRIHEIRPAARIARVEAGVILTALHDATAEHGLTFPMTFGARGSARIGGILSTNAGGSNVLAHGNARDLCLGIEAVMPDGQVLDLMSELHKDNSGYALRHLMIGAEGTLGIITGAVLKLRPLPRATATATFAARDLPAALALLNALQDATDGGVVAFEYMPGAYIAGHLATIDTAQEPFDTRHETNILVELATTAPEAATPGPDGTLPLTELLLQVLSAAMDRGDVLDAVLAQTEAQRARMWERRESAAEIAYSDPRPFVDGDICMPLDRVDPFLTRMRAAVAQVDADARDLVVAHLGDGNVHLTTYYTDTTPGHSERIRSAIEDVVHEMRGSFSAEHGIGRSKLGTMRRRKDPVALAAMKAIKAALDPDGLMNPGKVLPD